MTSHLDAHMTVEEYLAWYWPKASDFPPLRVELVGGTVYDERHLTSSQADAAHAAFDHFREHYAHVFMSGSIRVDHQSLWNPTLFVLNGPLVYNEDRFDEFDETNYIDATDVKLMVDVCDDRELVDVSRKVAIAGYAGIPEYGVVLPASGRLLRFRDPEELDHGRAYANVELQQWPEMLGTWV